MYSPSALAEYGIGVPVMNLGLGVERLAMVAYNANDLRQLAYPQFFPRLLTDHEIARAVHLREEPVSPDGKALAAAIARVAAANAAAQGPCSFTAWEGLLGGRKVSVVVEETESNAKLCGPACANEIFVHDGSVLGVPDTEKWKQVRTEGVSTGITRSCRTRCHTDRRGCTVREIHNGTGQGGKTSQRHQPEDRRARDALCHGQQEKSGCTGAGLPFRAIGRAGIIHSSFFPSYPGQFVRNT
jgi:hypothetical protein